MRTDAESTIIVVWLVLALVFGVGTLYDAIGNGDWPAHLLVLVGGQLVLAGLAKLAFRLVRRWYSRG
jgi:membrane associated rhomboid family serine protease